MSSIPKEPTPSERLSRVHEALSRHYHGPDIQGFDVICAAYAAHRLYGQPVWLTIIAPPSSGKAWMEAFGPLDKAHIVDAVTKNTFLSGQIVVEGEGRPPSLLHRFGDDAVILIPDFSTIASLPRAHRNSVLADMRKIYDGHLRKEFGTAASMAQREWKGKVTFIIAATPQLEHMHAVMQPLGERFVSVRWSRPGQGTVQGGIEAARVAIKQDAKAARSELCSAVSGLFAGLPSLHPELSDGTGQAIACLAEFTSRARAHIVRDSRKRIIAIPEPEGSTRLAQQLAQLARGFALIRGSGQVEEADLSLARRVAMDSIPGIRRKFLDHLIAANGNPDQPPLDMPSSTKSYAKEELEALGLISEGRLSSEAIALHFAAGLQNSARG